MTLNRSQKWIAYVCGGAVVTASAALVIVGLTQKGRHADRRAGDMIPAKLEAGTLSPPLPDTAGAAGMMPGPVAPTTTIEPLSLQPGETYYGKGEALFLGGDFAAASRYLQSEVEAHPDRFYPSYLLGLSLWREGRLEEAIGSLTKAVSADATSVKAMVNLGRVLNDAGRFGEALAAADAAIGADPESSAAHNARGCALLNLARRDDAIASFNTAIELEPGNAWALNNLGYALIGAGRCGEAVSPLEQAIRMSPGVGIFHNNLGMAYERTGRRGEAVAEYRAAVEAGAVGAAERNLERLGGLAPADAIGSDPLENEPGASIEPAPESTPEPH
jgi:Flp pilus assembly protein TadD